MTTIKPAQLSALEDLTHAVAGLVHVEEPCLKTIETIRHLEMEKKPLQKNLEEKTTKLTYWKKEEININSWSIQWFFLSITCEVKAELERVRKHMKKDEELVREATSLVEEVDERIRDVERQNEKNEVDYRSLKNHREDLTELLDELLKGQDFGTEASLRKEIDDLEKEIEEAIESYNNLDRVRVCLTTADTALLEAILDLRQSNKEKEIGEGNVYFPQIAYDAIKEARELCKSLPPIQAPDKLEENDENTKAFYSPVQRYLWSVRRQLELLLEWCDKHSLDLVAVQTAKRLASGEKIDEWNRERRRLVKQVIL
ncbi:hypothetical protein J3Q64DRAFT_1775330 [Phycomyces blakesleeanus]|uniref:Uncharacterized protein n=2 Tax=Phycomyces blakesleeanus TaxID=4837 RepID=A0A162WX56_PHYB8|nr:hypothetical protein PHYBLDRAFT_182223 [Phycomyces blakesleeanus NRRL 1555(-)]OAD71345.1 hypothetical protein PHYBLDRAFT_182223 [Phycomyces blakesleeanus NRRL 1555(-)]|eukprot:XP_018289385.1 hypothetical protein PHYBLDRAFT_182223 [Phycomyces blakesleeanus NRRL 1555(-)]